jgi:hypothetical protein
MCSRVVKRVLLTVAVIATRLLSVTPSGGRLQAAASSELAMKPDPRIRF